MNYSLRSQRTEKKGGLNRLHIAMVIFILLAFWISFRLGVLMIFQHNFYIAMAADTHETYSHLIPNRGLIYTQDSRTKEEYPLAINRDYFLVYADTREIKDDATASSTADQLAKIFNYDETKRNDLYTLLNGRISAYKPIEKKIDEDTMNEIKSLKLKGINFVRNSYRYYPEKQLASNIVGFLGKNEKGDDVGRYGIEGYWDNELRGYSGYLSGVKSAGGGLISMANWSMKPAQDGADILLTIDRNLEYQACEELRKVQDKFGAKSASLIVMEPQTGAIRVMCSLPDFDPNNYGQVSSTEAYNNSAIFTSYEPGSVFKTITMAAAVNEGAVTPETTFVDPGQRADLCKTPIKNAMGRSYGLQNMSGILENSINTGILFVEERLGKSKFLNYVNKFGFGLKDGIELDTESSGDVSTLSLKKGDKVDCYAATAAFGQGLTVTPLQMITAYNTIANGGKLMKPYIVDEVRYPDGRVEKTKPKEIRQVLDKKSALLVNAMLVNVVDKTDKEAIVKGYYVGGKTGTAQIPGPGGYIEDTNHTFIGLAPIEDPKFVMLVKFEKPKAMWAESTTAPLFGELADFILKYYQIPPSR